MKVDLSCPNGCFELEVSGHHAERDDLAFLQDVAIQDEPGPCPSCGAAIDPQPVQRMTPSTDGNYSNRIDDNDAACEEVDPA